MIASRLWFDCTPTGRLFGLPVKGQSVRFSENVFYQYYNAKIRVALSTIDKAAIAAQL